MKRAILILAFAAGAPSAWALMCEGNSGDCDYRVYLGSSGRLSIFTSNCRYSDDNGGGRERVRNMRTTANGDEVYTTMSGETVTFKTNGTAVLDTRNEKIEMICR